LKLPYYKVIKMSLKKTLAKALTGVALVSSLYGLPVKKANALEMVYPSGLIMVYPDKDSKTKHSNKLYKKKEEKHYNWIRPSRYSKWQCAYELTYPSNSNKPKGFKLYVDKDGDEKVDYTFKYHIDYDYASANSFTYVFYRSGSSWPVGGIYDSWKKALNVCAPIAIRKLFYEREDTFDDPSTFEEMKIDSDYNYIEAEFLQ